MKRPYSSVPIFCVALLAAGAVVAQPVQPPKVILRGLAQPGSTIDLQVQFEHNSAQLTPQAVQQLEALAQALADPLLAPNRVRIEGHTDSDGSAAYNQVLSERRAQAVKHFLVEHGIGASRLDARGFGESRPIADESTADGKAQNRRVAVVNLGAAPSAATGEQKPAAEAKSQASTQDTGRIPKPPVANKPSVRVVVRYERNGQTDEVKPGSVLRPVDNYSVSLTPAMRSFVYVLRFDAQGNAAMLFPNKDFSATVNPLVARRSYVVPSEGQWLRLAGTPGEEEIVVLASAEEIEDPRGVAQTVRRSKGGGQRGVEPYPVKDEPVALPADLFSYRLPYKTQLP